MRPTSPCPHGASKEVGEGESDCKQRDFLIVTDAMMEIPG